MGGDVVGGLIGINGSRSERKKREAWRRKEERVRSRCKTRTKRHTHGPVLVNRVDQGWTNAGGEKEGIRRRH